MKNSLRLLVLSGMLTLLVSPAAFANGSGPGGSAPPGGSGGGTTTTTNTTINGTSTSGTTTILGEIISILEGLGL